MFPLSGQGCISSLFILTRCKAGPYERHFSAGTDACAFVCFQVVVLSEGYQLYTGEPGQAVHWFSNTLNYTYTPERDGAVSDWLMDMVSVGFAKPKDFAAR